MHKDKVLFVTRVCNNERRALYATKVVDPAAIRAAGVAVARQLVESWRASAARAKREEERCLTEAEHWRGERMECEAKAAAIVAEYSELGEEEDHA